MTDDAHEAVRRVLAMGSWAVVGHRQNPARPAYGVARFLQQYGKRIVPVHRQPEDGFGETAYPRLADVPHPIDVVDVVVNSTFAGDVADQAVAIGAKAVWFQLGVVDEGAAEQVRQRRPAHGDGPLPGITCMILRK